MSFLHKPDLRDLDLRELDSVMVLAWFSLKPKITSSREVSWYERILHLKREAYKRFASVDIICVTRRDCDSGQQTTWIKQSLSIKYTRVECQLNSDQALRLLYLKKRVSAWVDADWFDQYSETPSREIASFWEWLREDAFWNWRRPHEKGAGRHADASDETNTGRWRCVYHKLNGRAHLTWISQFIHNYEVNFDPRHFPKSLW